MVTDDGRLIRTFSIIQHMLIRMGHASESRLPWKKRSACHQPSKLTYPPSSRSSRNVRRKLGGRNAIARPIAVIPLHIPVHM